MKKLKTIGAMCISLFVIFVILIPTAVSYQNLEYVEWSIEKSEMSIFYDRMGREALSEGDWSSLKLYSDLSYNFYSDALAEIDKFDISPGYLSKAKDEDKACYEDMKWVAYYFNKIADAYLSGEGYNEYYFQKASSHLGSAISHTEKGIEYREKYLEEIENAPSSIDSDRDGVPDDYDYAPKDPNVQTKEDAKTPGFGAILAIICVLAVGYFVIRRRMR